jgi:hypothetical protein
MNPDVQDYLATYQDTQAYLRLSATYCDYLGGIRWSNDDDALVYRDGSTFAFCALIADFLEGFANGERAIPFGCVLHWIHLLQFGRRHPDAEVRRLHALFTALGSPWRNAGVLAAALAEGVPEPVRPPRLQHVCRRLRDRAFPIRWFIARFHESPTEPAQVPPMAPADFERLIGNRLAAYSEDELRSWLLHGRGPVHEAGNRLAREQPPPRSLTGVLAALLLRPRLAGAETYVTRLVGALTLPPRRLVPQELPVGGYADMTTHGAVEHLLPSQHALDELEFLRRFAERELLFFRREEPPAQNRQEIAVLLDQGVRTWGDVRLVLAAAALTLGKQCATRGQAFRVAGTSNGGLLLDPLEADADALGGLIEASDLSFHPAAALETVLVTRTDALRDIVLLTQPRNLREADVLAAARRAGPRDRLFAVALDEDGAATVSEIRHGAAVKLRQFRVEFAPSRPAPPPAEPAEPLAPLPPWTGDIEGVPFPFRFGTNGRIIHFEFDHDGRHMMTVWGDGMLHLWGLLDGHCEVLPRPCFDSKMLTEVKEVVGVLRGFVVLAVHESFLFAVHYDLARRRCRAWWVGPDTDRLSTRYLAELHTVLLRRGLRPGKEPVGASIDLTIGECLPSAEAADRPRARQAWEALDRPPVRRVRLNDLGDSNPMELTLSPRPSAKCTYRVDTTNGTIELRQLGYEDQMFIPTADGKVVLKGATVLIAEAAGDVLAMLAKHSDKTLRLLLIRGSSGAVLREHRYDPHIKEPRRFMLSPNGRWLAREGETIIIVENVDAPAAQLTTRTGGFPGEVQLFLGKQCMLLSQDRGQSHWHLVDWSDGTARFYHEKKGRDGPLQRDVFREAMQRWPLALVKAVSAAAPPSYDRQRFVAVADHDHLRFMLDFYGQVAVFDRRTGSLLCMLMAFRDRLAAWLPDGARCGSEALGLGPETPGARVRLAKALAGQ